MGEKCGLSMENLREQKIDLLIDSLVSKEQRLYFMFHSARKLQTFNRRISVAPRDRNVLFVRLSGTNGPKDSVFFQPWCIHSGCVFFFDNVTIWVGMRVCWPKNILK